MRLKIPRATAEELLNASLTEGFALMHRVAGEHAAAVKAGRWDPGKDRPAREALLNEWYARTIAQVGSIFPTEREAYEVIYPPNRGLSAVSGDYEWQSLMLNVREKLHALRGVIDNRLRAYTDLPLRLRLYVEDIESFQKVRDVNPAMVAGRLRDGGYLDMPEDQVQIALEQILDVPFHKKDWGGESNDLYTSNIVLNGSRIASAFLLKGNGLRKATMEIANCGKNGDQILRLMEGPAQLFVVQFVGEVSEAVIKDVEGKVAQLRAAGRDACFLIMNGQDTARVLHAYGKLS
ncbi:MAG: hypothetical protein PHS79_00115 [Patescibacteria group bacterium]|nr:hypothetical protein [Patescibacteria group bacterium]